MENFYYFSFKNSGAAGDAQQRIEDHLSGKQHIGYSKLRKAVEEIHQQRKSEREKEDKYDNKRRGGGAGGGGGNDFR